MTLNYFDIQYKIFYIENVLFYIQFSLGSVQCI